MPVTVHLSTALRDHVPDYQPSQGLTMDLNEVRSLLDLARNLNLPVEDIKITMLNGRRVDLNSPVSDGDRVAFFPAVGGG